MPLSKEQFTLVVRKLRERREESARAGRIDNSTLPAGSPMYYYCRLCGLLAATLPETHLEAPPRRCEACERLFGEYGLTSEELEAGLKALPEPDPRYADGEPPAE